MAIPILAGHFDRAGYAQILQPVAGDQTGVIAGAAGDDVDTLHLPEQLARFRPEAVFQQSALMDATFQGFGDDGRLLEDFLQHEMAIAALACGSAHLAGIGQRPFDRPSLPVVNGEAFPLDLSDIAFFQKHEALRHRRQREHIRGNKMLLDTDAQHQRTAGTSRDHPIRILAADHAQAVGTGQLGDALTHGCQQVAAVFPQVLVDQVGDHFGIGVGCELVASGG